MSMFTVMVSCSPVESPVVNGIKQDSPVFNVENNVKLTERMRQKEDSPILPITDVFADAVENNNEQELVLDRKNNFNETDRENVRLFSKISDFSYEQDGSRCCNRERQPHLLAGAYPVCDYSNRVVDRHFCLCACYCHADQGKNVGPVEL